MKKKKFALRNIAYQEKDGSFTGVCLDLDLVEEGHVTLEEAILSINDAIFSHMRTAEDAGFPKELTRRPAPKEYWDKLSEVTKPQLSTVPFDQFRFFLTPSGEYSHIYV